MIRGFASFLGPAALLAGLLSPAAAEPITVFAAASLTDAMRAIGQRYGEATGVAVRFSFAASSTLARQIAAGAPAQIFASANETWMDYLADRGLIDPDSRVSPIGNQLVLIAPAASASRAVTITPDLDLAALLGADGRLAVGDPAHVPAGIYAEQALRALGLWHGLAPRLARMGNVRAALALVEHGEAPLGIVYATDARITQGVRAIGTFPADSHAPITYPFAIVKGAGSDAVRALFAYVTGAPGLAVFQAQGFSAN